MQTLRTVLPFIAFLMLISPLCAQPGEPPKVLRLTLEDCVGMALQSNS